MNNSSYTVLRQIIDLLEKYEQTDQPVNLPDFAFWIIGRHSQEYEIQETPSIKRRTPENQENFSMLKNLRFEARFLEYISRMARYHEFYIRKALQDLTINTRLEFMFLKTVGSWEFVKKTDLINLHLLEYTTGMDTIHRLIRKGLIEEVPNPEDKRVRWLRITGQGIKVLEASEKKIREENGMFFQAISNRWKKALPVLEEIDSFHNKIYQDHNEKPFAEICNLVDSLKHIYK